jgi:outer membrane protein assembly factor BamB
VFAATTTGIVTARDLATGAVVWTSAGNGPIVASPAVVGNSVYVGTESHFVFAFDAATGAVQCAFSLGGAVVSSPVVGTVDSTGPVVFFGDVGAGVANSPGYMWAINGVGDAGTPCTRRWDFDGWNNAGPEAKRTGTWSPPALTTDSLGRPLLVFGSSDPDEIYPLDARTGTLVWRFQTKVTAPDQDVGAAPTISPPGVGGFRHGVVYIDGKDNIEYALDLLTGRPI